MGGDTKNKKSVSKKGTEDLDFDEGFEDEVELNKD